MKKFTRTETIRQTVGLRFKRTATIKRFRTEDGLEHEFTTWLEGVRDAAVIALTSNNEVITIYQFRAGPERWMYEIPGGAIEGGESYEAGALRELKEETGYEPEHLEYLGENSRDAYSNGVWRYYLATGCKLSPDGWHPDKTELDQGVEVRLISIAELLDNARHDRMTDPAAVLMAYDKLKEIANGTSN
ncbi:MAG TPA: NUDIX hydrolase [Candidatus Saccharimonadales bacterium]|jgi:ADP-ribose pyrophosphatase